MARVSATRASFRVSATATLTSPRGSEVAASGRAEVAASVALVGVEGLPVLVTLAVADAVVGKGEGEAV